MIRVIRQGRTGNVLLQNIGISIIAKKFNKHVDNYTEIQFVDDLGLSLFSGSIVNDKLVNYTDGDLMELLKSDRVENGIFFNGLFQLRDFVTDYKSDILSHFDLKHESKPEQVFVHVRLGDVTHMNPGLNYYKNALDKLNFKSGYISSDTKNSNIVQTLMTDYNLQFYEDEPVRLINFAKNFENLVLSKGTFSWWIGFLSKASKIYFPTNDVGWHGDIFVFDDWIPIDLKSI